MLVVTSVRHSASAASHFPCHPGDDAKALRCRVDVGPLLPAALAAEDAAELLQRCAAVQSALSANSSGRTGIEIFLPYDRLLSMNRVYDCCQAWRQNAYWVVLTL